MARGPQLSAARVAGVAAVAALIAPGAASGAISGLPRQGRPEEFRQVAIPCRFRPKQKKRAVISSLHRAVQRSVWQGASSEVPLPRVDWGGGEYSQVPLRDCSGGGE